MVFLLYELIGYVNRFSNGKLWCFQGLFFFFKKVRKYLIKWFSYCLGKVWGWMLFISLCSFQFFLITVCFSYADLSNLKMPRYSWISYLEIQEKAILWLRNRIWTCGGFIFTPLGGMIIGIFRVFQIHDSLFPTLNKDNYLHILK